MAAYSLHWRATEAAAEAQGGRKKVEATAQHAAGRHGRIAKSCANAEAGGKRVQKSGGGEQEEDKAERRQGKNYLNFKEVVRTFRHHMFCAASNKHASGSIPPIAALVPEIE